jgi:transmembrane sensor
MTDKGRILAFPDAAAIEAEAAAWVARFDAGDVSAKDQAAFQEWLNRGALHREAIAAYGNLWSEFDALRHLTDARGASDAHGVADAHEAGQEGRAHDNQPAMLKRARPWLAACAAVVIATVGGAVLLHPKPQQSPKAQYHPPARLSYETPVGGQRKIMLADGSSVLLNTNSRLDVNFSGKRRDVHLVRGEAYFEVVHDKTRPFTVYAKNYAVRDLGTAFDVHLSRAGMVEVGVTKGRVEVTPAGDAHVPDADKSLGVIAAGHNIVLGQKAEPAKAVSRADMGRKLAWRRGQLVYTGQPLKEVLADISRYSDIKIELADPALEDLPVGGAFRTDQIEAIFAALENNFGIHAEWVNSQHVRLTAARGRLLSRD